MADVKKQDEGDKKQASPESVQLARSQNRSLASGDGSESSSILKKSTETVNKVTDTSEFGKVDIKDGKLKPAEQVDAVAISAKGLDATKDAPPKDGTKDAPSKEVPKEVPKEAPKEAPKDAPVVAVDQHLTAGDDHIDIKSMGGKKDVMVLTAQGVQHYEFNGDQVKLQVTGANQETVNIALGATPSDKTVAPALRPKLDQVQQSVEVQAPNAAPKESPKVYPVTDASGNVLATKNAMGQVTEFKYDSSGKVNEINSANVSLKLDAATNTWTGTDTAGKVLKVSDVQVDRRTGDYVLKLPDGGRLERNADGSILAVDAQGKVRPSINLVVPLWSPIQQTELFHRQRQSTRCRITMLFHPALLLPIRL